MPRRSHGSLFRRKRDGKPAGVWFIAYQANGRRVTERAFLDKRASEQFLAQRLQEAAREQVGLTDPYRRHRRAPLAEHLAAFLDGIASRNRTAKHHRLTKARLERAFEAMRAKRIDDQIAWVKANLARRGEPVRTEINKALLLSVKRLRQQGQTYLEIGRRCGLNYHQVREVARVVCGRQW